MIWFAIAALALIVMAPLVFLAWRGGKLRDRREAALALHRAQLAELDRDLAQGRLLPEEHAGAVLEVQRRLLADAAIAEAPPARSGRIVVGVTATAIPLAAVALYILTAGHPGPPPPAPPPDAMAGPPGDAPMTPDDQAREAAQEDQEIGILKSRLALMDPHAPRTIEGWGILGRAELGRGNLAEAADAFRHVLAEHFDPTLGAETAEIITEANNGRSPPEAVALFRRALAEAPPDAPWRPMAEKRLQAARGS